MLIVDCQRSRVNHRRGKAKTERVGHFRIRSHFFVDALFVRSPVYSDIALTTPSTLTSISVLAAYLNAIVLFTNYIAPQPESKIMNTSRDSSCSYATEDIHLWPVHGDLQYNLMGFLELKFLQLRFACQSLRNLLMIQ